MTPESFLCTPFSFFFPLHRVLAKYPKVGDWAAQAASSDQSHLFVMKSTPLCRFFHLSEKLRLVTRSP